MVAAAVGDAKGDAMVTVMQSPRSVIVTPAADSVAEGDTLRLSAEAMDANGHPVVGAEFSWSSLHRSVATVDANGLVRGVEEGATFISAVAGSARGTAFIIVHTRDRAALVALYEATDGPNWVNSENWLTDAPLQDWYGVRMAGARVDYLGLDRNGLNGPIPPELVWLTGLRALYLTDNSLYGPIPSELSQLKHLEDLDVGANPGLRGEIPPAILSNLEILRSYGTGLCVPRDGDFESYVSRRHWIGYACGEAEPGFQIQLLFHPDTPGILREAMNRQADYWMEILRETEVPDLFGHSSCYPEDWTPAVPHVIDDIVVSVEIGGGTYAELCGWEDVFRHRIPDKGYVTFRPSDATNLHWVDLIARHELGHVLGVGTLWRIRGQLKNPSTSQEVRDTYVVSPLATEAFDAAGGTNYTGPKVPLHQHGRGRNSHWRFQVFGGELMSGGVGENAPTSAVTLQALADLGYTVDLSLADPFRLLGAAALSADAPLFLEPGWEAPPRVVLCRPRALPFWEPEGLLSDRRRSGLRSNALRVGSAGAMATPRADCKDLMRR